MQPKCGNCNSLIIIGTKFCCVCGAYHGHDFDVPDFIVAQGDNGLIGALGSSSSAQNSDVVDEIPLGNCGHLNYPATNIYFSNTKIPIPTAPIWEAQETCVSEDATAKQEQFDDNGQTKFSIVNIVLGILSVVVVGAILGFWAMYIIGKAKLKPESDDDLAKALKINIAAIVINILFLAAIIIIVAFFHPYIFPSGYDYY